MLPTVLNFGDLLFFTSEWSEDENDVDFGILSRISAETYMITSFPGGNRWTDARKTEGLYSTIDLRVVERHQGIKIVQVVPANEVAHALRGLKSLPAAPKKKGPVSNKVYYTNAKIIIRNTIERTKGKIFTVCFTKLDGEDRIMNCRLGVGKYVKGTGHKQQAPDVITVYDLQINDYRSFNLNRVKWVKADGVQTFYRKG